MTFTTRRAAALLLSAPIAMSAAPLSAARADGLSYGGEISTHLQAESISAEGSGHKATIYDDTDITAFVHWSDWLSINSDVKLERQRNDNLDNYYPTSNTAFRSEGVTLRQLNATVRPVQGLSAWAGKIHPRFGSAPSLATYQFGMMSDSNNTQYSTTRGTSTVASLAKPWNFSVGVKR